MRKIKILTLTTILVFSVLGSGCCIKHEFAEATCTEPATCIKCGETEGEPLGHTWAEATCTEPATCTVCGETTGTPLGHDYAGATLWDPGICTRCGAVGTCLPSAYEQCKLTVCSDFDTPQEYITFCRTEELTSTGSITMTGYSVFASDETHETVEGSLWQSATFLLEFSDENARSAGFTFTTVASDYYTGTVLPYEGAAAVTYRDTEFIPRLTATANVIGWEGEEYEDMKASVEITVTALVPEGYDGLVINFLEGVIDSYASNISEMALYHTDFRLPKAELTE